MNLKEQFIKTLEILISDDPACGVHIGFYCNDYDCNSNNCRECISESKIKADVIFEYVDEGFARYYVFNKEYNREFIKVINTEEDMYAELTYLKENYINKHDKEALEYYRKIEKLKSYSDKYANELVEKYFPQCKKNILPIRFHEYLENTKEYSSQNFTSGTYIKRNNQNIIDIYCCFSSDLEELKKTIRHEIIHYLLDMADLKYDDSDAVFHALCTIENAGAYKPMSEKDKEIYDLFMFIYNHSTEEEREEYCTTINLIIMAGTEHNENIDTLIKGLQQMKKQIENKVNYEGVS